MRGSDIKLVLYVNNGTHNFSMLTWSRSLHVHLNQESCLEVTVLKGHGAEVQAFANQVIAERGVRHGQVVYVPAPAGMTHGHHHAEGHAHKRSRRRMT